jgi:hypothetical protein
MLVDGLFNRDRAREVCMYVVDNNIAEEFVE